jgi:hypothetical protein
MAVTETVPRPNQWGGGLSPAAVPIIAVSPMRVPVPNPARYFKSRSEPFCPAHRLSCRLHSLSLTLRARKVGLTGVLVYSCTVRT